MARWLKSKWQLVPIIVLAILAISEIVWYAPPTHPQAGSFQVISVTPGSGSATVGFRIQAQSPLDATVVIVPVTKEHEDLPVYIFFDQNYPTVGTNWALTQMLWEHVKTQLELRGYAEEVKLVNAEELKAIMQGESNCIVIISSGGLPANVFSLQPERNLVTPWIEGGGMLIWLGDAPPGYYVVDKGGTEELGEKGVKLFGLEGFYDFEGWPEFADTESPLSEALDITYNFIQQAPLVSMVKEEGLILGKKGGEAGKERTSVAGIPMEEGWLIDFGYVLPAGGVLNGPELTARDIAQILCSGVLKGSSTSAIQHRSYHLGQGKTITDSITIPIDAETAGLVIYAYHSIDSEGLLFYKEFRNLSC
jgi:hypothetical protein